MQASLTVLGSNSAAPTKSRNQSSYYLRIGSNRILLDCGEATQKRLIENRINYQKIQYILISHLHGDHCLGLFGLLNTMSLNGRKSDLKIVGPKGIKDLLTTVRNLTGAHDTFEVDILELEPEENQSFTLGNLNVKAFPLSHRLPCFGYRIDAPEALPGLNIDACNQHEVPYTEYGKIKEGSDFTKPNGDIVPNEELVYTPETPFSFGYITDTLLRTDLAEAFEAVKVLYHEATYLHNLIDRAKRTFHSTAQEAAMFATQASVNQLIIGHFSSRYADSISHLAEASTVFDNTSVALEGKTFEFH